MKYSELFTNTLKRSYLQWIRVFPLRNYTLLSLLAVSYPEFSIFPFRPDHTSSFGRPAVLAEKRNAL